VPRLFWFNSYEPGDTSKALNSPRRRFDYSAASSYVRSLDSYDTRYIRHSIHKMSTSTATVKVLIILESPKDWDEWFEVVRNSAQVSRILHLINPELAVQPAQPVRPNEPQYTDVNSTFDLDN
jgi:hypothetical protein